MGELDVSGYPPSKVVAVVEAIKARDSRASIKLSWHPPPSTPVESPADAVRRLSLVQQRLKG